MYGRRMHLMLEMGPKLKELMEGVVELARSQKKDINEILVSMIHDALDYRQAIEGAVAVEEQEGGDKG